MDLVTFEYNKRMGDGFKAKFNQDMTEDERNRLYSLGAYLKLHPLVNTFVEMDEAISCVKTSLTS